MDGGLIGRGLDLQICSRVGGLDLEFGQIPLLSRHIRQFNVF